VAKTLNGCRAAAGSLPPCELANKPTGKQKKLQDELRRIQVRIYKIAAAFSKKFEGAELHIDTEELDGYNPYGSTEVRYRARATFTYRPKIRKSLSK
jgi:hypothetical protein